ncbi:MAG: hypothetical protein A2Y03_10705 [Omnitrophica WOR_2 bacterium GWF2_38_59]|nr:MAG: hypothetical protein A2Y06_03665 [Omnitrophica WOR_2 bacterium GWA2_37_7]OGX25158.1 MAG: hypothetical protein A2Y03_10705 [Omnitrophica WOR_2 bacterium GWF2_38_59]OGX50651.1 MAG: hypothetical protein A2243_03530 [Omnitrophica WOR_2 bacterium RIFOXYA2_FULL_38_17]OGX56168.1 MAG: hypothetical protein A2447_07880 [Omnitrophica WOR_2 bacterium RIFOXYC2_FULL_38_12]OGX60397.1 MAG: hypothetical protein A2306_09080 [Omnitrophica WOR_2 bacterium RIFOXYB2_FULL_38_16]HBG60931.1 hypothetical protei
MFKHKLVEVPSAAFNFCRITVAILVWISFFFRSKEMVLFIFLIFLFSAILKIRKAPMVFLYTNTINKIKKSKDIILDEYALAFAHSLGAIFSFIALICFYFFNPKAGWMIIFLLALLKTSGACGFCSALKLYGCMSSNNCCSFIKGKKND